MMKLILIAALLAVALPAAAPAQSQERVVPPKLFASAAEVDAALAKARLEHKTGNTVEVLVSVGPYPVQLEYRTATTPPSMHKGQAELIYVVAGGCTLIQGGSLVGMKGEGTTVSGISIEGGTPHKVAKGDYIMVPPDTPHQYADVQGEFVSVTLHMPMAAQ
jgi:uncharacterized RmlC-like cupin family protein